MKLKNLVSKRYKETPADCQIASQALMMRGGYIKPVGNGIYTLFPVTKRVTSKIEKIIREEMNRIDGQELLFPVAMPASIWRESGRYDAIGSELLRFKDRSEQDMVLVKEMAPGADMMHDAETLAASIYETLTTEFAARGVCIGIGSIVGNLKDLSRAYKEARISLEVGKVFDTEKTYISYENLGIGRLVYQLPTTLCEIFLDEVFKKGSLESLDHDTQATVQSFFENNLNVSETSRKLFVHRNTLVYRLEKIRKLTGLDLRRFEDAVTFKVALMVKKYLVSKPAKF